MVTQLEGTEAQRRRGPAELSIALVAGLGLAATALFLCAVPLAGHLAGSRDFISYWATGQQLVHHANPYDRQAVAQIEHAQGLDTRAVLIMRNPPWALPLAWPLGFLSARLAVLLWSILLSVCLWFSVRIVRRLHGSPANYLHWLALAFTPALICLIMGQTTLLSLLGLALFLRFHRERPFGAGAALWLCALKPHLFLPFSAALAAWILYSRAWRVLGGAVVALAASTAVALLIAPRAWPDYLRMLRSPLVENDFTPCIADALHRWLFPQQQWIRYVPTAVASIWALVYYLRRRTHWNWVRNGSALILVSLVFAPYAWLYDQCLAIPPLLEAAYATGAEWWLTALALMIFAADLQLAWVKVISPLWLWTAPGWLVWWLIAKRCSREIETEV